MQGVVKSFSPVKGYGFIIFEGKEYFVHYTQIKMDGYKTLTAGATVEFEIGEGPHGIQACNVVPQ